MSDLFGLELVQCDYLPKTVLDRDGNEVELLGVAIEPPSDLDVFIGKVPRMTVLVGGVIPSSQKGAGK